MSFYQVNPVQAEILYTTAINQANLDKNDILFDLYCGIGTIGISASKYVNKSIWNRDSSASNRRCKKKRKR